MNNPVLNVVAEVVLVALIVAAIAKTYKRRAAARAVLARSANSVDQPSTLSHESPAELPPLLHAFLLWKELRHEEAEKEVRRAIAMGDTGGYRLLGVILDELGRPTEAIAALRQAVASGDADARESLERVERDHEKRRAAGEPPSAWAQPADWKVSLLREMGETGLADKFQRRLDERPDPKN